MSTVVSLTFFRSAFPRQQLEEYDGLLAISSIVAVRHERNQALVEDEARQLKQHREVLKRTRMIYHSLRLRLIKEEKKNPRFRSGLSFRSDRDASYKMRDLGLWINKEGKVGSIPGIETGDMFFYRMEMFAVGLHAQPQSGIDYLKAQQSSDVGPIATSIIVSGNYEDGEDEGDVLVYTGQGGQDRRHRQSRDQRLGIGNLAMETSYLNESEIRVTRGFKYENNNVSSKVYVYDGLYRISDFSEDRGRSGFVVYKFTLVRIEGQPEKGSMRMKFARTLRSKPLMVRPTGYISLDLSCKDENVPVYLYNDIDGDDVPLRNYTYLAKSVFAHEGEINMTGCDCNNSCTEDCSCARKNGGEFAYGDNGTLFRGKPVIFECGISCKCGPSCKNRVTQKGMRIMLEVFKSRETGWSVKTLDIIPAGAFICEYAGLIVTKDEAEIMSMSGDPMVYPGQFTVNWSNWGDLSQVYLNEARPDDPTLAPLDFAIDMSKKRNVASYIRHSKEPNVMVQFVFYDHNDLKFPRVMLFAMENISPLTELSLDYGVAG